MERHAADARCRVLRCRPARHHGATRSGSPACTNAAHRRPVHRGRHRPHQVNPVRAVARSRPRPARLGTQHHHRVRRSQPHDPVQRQIPEAGIGGRLRRPLHLPRAAGCRHPALRRRCRAGGRRPTSAHRTDPGSRRSLQHSLRRHPCGARGADPQRDRQGLRPAEPGRKDVEVGREPGRNRLVAR